MKSPSRRIRFFRNLSFVFFLSSCLFLAGSDLLPKYKAAEPGQTQTQPGVSDLVVRKRGESRSFAELLSTAQAGGSVRVIVGLRLGFQPEGHLNRAAVQAQRRAIAQAQTAVLNRLPANQVSSVKRFNFIPFLAFEIDAAGLEQLRTFAEVTTIEEDQIQHVSLAESVPLIGAPAAWASGFAGAGQAVAILDTGVDKTHPFLAGKVVSEACYSTTGSATTSVCPDGVSQSTTPGAGVNCNAPGCEHGTHVAGIAAGKSTSFSGVARDANIIAIQVFSRINGCPSSASDCVGALNSDILQGLERVRTLSSTINIAAVNLSLGGGQYTTNCDAAQPAYKTAIDNLRSLGVATIVASGNESHTGALAAPACVSSAISVGSTGDGSNGSTLNTVSSFSNSASFLNLLAPGEWINSSVPGGTFANFRGTSQAAPHVAGAWAVLKSKTPTASVSQVLQAFTNTGLSVTDQRNGLIKPRIRVDAAVNALAGVACNYAITPSAQSFNGNGGSGTVNVTAAAGCVWTAGSNVPWITITSGGNGAGNGVVSYTAAANMGLERTGTLLVAGQSFSVTQTGIPNLAVDDGSFEDALGSNSGGVRYAVNRLTPPSYPATINRVAIFFPSGTGLSVGAPVTILAGTNPSGSANLNGIAPASFPATVQALDQFNLYDIPITTIDSGDFVVGFQRTLAAREFPFALDETPTSKQRSYISSNGSTFTLLDDPAVGIPGNFGIRAVPVQGPLAIAAGSVIGVESCQPANNVVDPNEAVIAALSLRNVGAANLTNLVATLQATGGVTAPGGPQTYGALTAGGPAIAKSFSFTANGACGSKITATLNLQDGATNLGSATFTFTLGVPRTATSENFDGVSAPALPAGWTSTIGAGSGSSPQWVTSTTNSETAPNNAFATDPESTSDVRLDSPSIAIATTSAQLTFRNNYDTESRFDGGVLEISIANAAFADIISAGGSFVTGGYNDTLFTGSNPIGGRMAWTGRSAGYITTTVNLPAAAAGKNIKLRWRMTSDSIGSGVGWRIDGIKLTDGNTCATDCSASCLTLGSISPTGQSFTVSGGAGAVNLTLPQNCNWTASSQAPWLTIISGASGSGSGAVNYSVAANTGSEARTGTLLIAGRVFTVTQAGCGFAIAPTSQNVEPAGGAGSIAVTAAGGCTWTATSNAPWITINSGAGGSGNGAVNFMVAPHTGTSARTGTLTVAGLTFTVTQAACMYAIAPASQVFGVAGGAGSVAITAQGGCAWTTTNNVPWITITSGASGSGNGAVNFTVAPGLTDSSRTGALTIAGQTLTVTQVPYTNDVRAAGFDLPSSVLVGRPVTIRVRVTNSGSSPQSNFSVSYQINNEFPVTETFTEMLAPLQTVTKSFTALWTPYVPGPYQITARTHLSGDQNTANDAAQTSVQAAQAQYRGVWQGSTSSSRPISFIVDENDVVASLGVDIGITFFAPPSSQVTCVGTFRNSESGPISGGQFNVPLTPPGGVSISNTVRARGGFSSPTAASGSVDSFSVNLIICGGFLGFGANVNSQTWTALRQVSCPTVSGVAPASGIVGSQVVITGTNFTDVSSVKFAGNIAASFILNDSTRITTTVPAGAVSGPITISKTGCPTDVQTSAFTILNSPAPTLTALNLNSLTAGGPAFTLMLTGTNFTAGSIARWNGGNRPTMFVSGAQLLAAIPANDIAAAGAASVTVFNPAPGGGASNAINFTILSPCPTIALTPASLPAGTLNAAYNQTITASGGAAPYSFALSAGTLPTGLTLSSAGVLSGAPTQRGNFNITVKATDAGANRCTGEQSYTLTINCQTITVNPATLPAGLAGIAYHQTLTQTGGVGAATFSLGAGTLPTGLTLSSAGVLSGTTTQTGSFPITVKATDANGCPGARDYTLVINNCPIITLSPAALPDSPGGVVYNQTLTASGGTAPYSFAVTAGALPGGLTLATGGALSGAPNAAGAFNFTVTATDANGCKGARSYTVNITVTLGGQTRALYVLNDDAGGNQIYGVAVNEATGALTLLPGFPLSTGGNGVFGSSEKLTIDRANLRLYALNDGSGTVSAYAINPTTGALTPLPFSPINLGLAPWSTVALHPSGSPLVVGDRNGRVLSYQITTTTATAAAGSPYSTGSATPVSIAFSQDGNFVYTGGSLTAAIAGFSVNVSTGVLTALAGSPFGSGANFPLAYATDIAGRLFVTNSEANQARVFTTASGILTAASGNPFTSGLTNAVHGQLHPNGFYLVADGLGKRVGVYRISGSGSATTLTAVTGSPFAAGDSLPNVLALNQAGTFLFAANGDSRNLRTFSVNSTTGALTALGAQPANTLGSSGNITGMAYFASPCSTIALSPATLPNGTAGAAYDQTVTASPALTVGNYNFSVTAGALPAGLSFNSTTGAISGTPTAAGAASFTITALSFGPCSGSQAYSLTINNPLPTLTSLNPSSTLAGSPAFTLTVAGKDFVNGAVVRWNGNNRATIFISGTLLTASIPASDIANAGMANVTVFNPEPGGGTSNPVPFTINNPTPALLSLSPNSATAGGSAFTLTVNGMGFVNTSVVRWNNVDRVTNFVNSAQVTATIPASDLATEGTASVTVFNPASGGGVSNALSFTIIKPNPMPMITTLTPNPVIAGGQGFTLAVNGKDFVSGATVRWNGGNRTTAFVNAGQLTAAIPAADIAAAGTARITVVNPAPGGGTSNEAVLTIANALANVPAASFTGSVIAPDSIVAAFGVKLATAMKAAPTTPLPTELEGTTVKITDSLGAERLAQLFFISPTQINYLTPAQTANGTATVTVKSGDGSISVGTVTIATVAPALFTANSSGQGVAAGVALRVKADGQQIYEPIAQLNQAQNQFIPLPIDLGPAGEEVFLILYGTGIRYRSSLSAVTVNIGGLAQQVLFAAAAPGFDGLDQANIGLSRALAGRGEVDVVLTVDGKAANTVKVSVK